MPEESAPPNPPEGPPEVGQPGNGEIGFPAAESAASPPQRPRPWEAQEGEGAAPFAAARRYFELGADRSLTEVAKQCKKNRSLIARWCQEWTWVERAKAYDRHMARIAQKAREKAVAAEAAKWAKRREEIRETEWKTAEQLQKLADQTLANALKYGEQFKPGETLQIVKLAMLLRRLSAEMPTRPAAAPAHGERPEGARRSPREDGPASS